MMATGSLVQGFLRGAGIMTCIEVQKFLYMNQCLICMQIDTGKDMPVNTEVIMRKSTTTSRPSNG